MKRSPRKRFMRKFWNCFLPFRDLADGNERLETLTADVRQPRPVIAGFKLQFDQLVITVALALAAFSPERAAADAKNFNGHYELAAAKSDRSFSLDVKQQARNDRATIAFSVAMGDGTGSAPDATGKGDVDNGILTFKFKDSYNNEDNEGTGTLEFKKNAYQLSLTVVKVVDPTPFHFYGSMLLKLTSKDGSALPSQK